MSTESASDATFEIALQKILNMLNTELEDPNTNPATVQQLATSAATLKPHVSSSTHLVRRCGRCGVRSASRQRRRSCRTHAPNITRSPRRKRAERHLGAFVDPALLKTKPSLSRRPIA